MISAITKLHIIYQQTGVEGTIRRLLSFVHTRWLLFSGIIIPHMTQKNAHMILAKQGGDAASLEVFTQILSFICQPRLKRQIIRILVPNYLGPCFRLIHPLLNKGKVLIAIYSDLGEIASSFDLCLIQTGISNFVADKLTQHLNDQDLIFFNHSFFLFANNQISPSSNSDLSETKNILLRELTKIASRSSLLLIDGPEQSKFYIRPNSMDSNIIDEVQTDYLAYIKAKKLRPKNVVDLGAHIGAFSIQIAKLMPDNGQIVCCEPAPTNFALLQKNIQENRLPVNILAQQCAVSDRIGSATLFLSSDNSGGHRLHLPDPSSQTSVTVNVTTIEEIFHHFSDSNDGIIDILKIDVEGSEHSILLPFGTLLSQRVKVIIAEAGGSINGDGLTILYFLQKLGFSTEYSGSAALMTIKAINQALPTK